MADGTRAASPAHGEDAKVRVWDPFVRIFHWMVVVCFFIAYFTEDDALTLHVWAGYVVGVLVAMRIVWGFIGPKHARFWDFIFSPFRVWSYLADLVRFRGKRYLGHSPAGGAMVIVLLIGLAFTVFSGLKIYAIAEHSGPLAKFEATVAQTAPTSGARRSPERRFWHETHEILANVMMVLVIVHIGGVVLASVVHRENLPRAMITGDKRAE